MKKIEAIFKPFKLDEVREADILLHVVDISHPQFEEQIGVVNKTLQELKAFDKPILMLFNKMDRYEKNTFDPWPDEEVKAGLLQDLAARHRRGFRREVCVLNPAA